MAFQLPAFGFFEEDTPLHRCDPRSKMVLLAAFSVLGVLINDLIPLLLLLGLLLLVMAVTGLMTPLLQSLRNMSFLFYLILIFNTLLGSVHFAVLALVRILILMLTFSVYFQTTLPEDLAQALVQMHLSYWYAFTLSLSFRFVPTLAEEVETITEAQMSRGHRLESEGFFNQVRNLFPLLIPLIMGSVRRADQVAEALYTRAFGAAKKRTTLYRLVMGKRDWALMAGSGTLLALGLCYRFGALLVPAWLGFAIAF
jgi:energy-coupling factor transport system permease protein